MTSQKRFITAEDLYNFELVSSLEISPDGQHVVYALQRVDQESEKKFSNLWILPTDGGEARQFTYGVAQMVARWQPDRFSLESKR